MYDKKLFYLDNEPRRFHEPPQTQEESPHANKRSRRRRWLAKFVLPVMLLCCFVPEVMAENFNRSPFLSTDITISWNQSYRRFEFKFCIARFNDNPDTYYDHFDMQINNSLTLFRLNYANWRDGGKINYTINCLNNSDDGYVNISGYNHGTTGTLTFYQTASGPEQSNVWLTVFWYPTTKYADQKPLFDCYATKNGNVIHNDVKYNGPTAENPVWKPTVTGVTYLENGRMQISGGNMNAPVRGVEYIDAKGSRYGLVGSVNASGATTTFNYTGTVDSVLVTKGWSIFSYNTWNLETAQRMDYKKYSDEYKIPPIKLPSDLRIEDIGAGKVSLKWTVDNTSQHSQAGEIVIYVYAKVGAATQWTLVKDAITVAYTEGKYEYELPASYIGRGKTTFDFDVYRKPFLKAYVTKKEFVRNMNYRIPTITSIEPSGASGINISWSNDDGYYLNTYQYRIKVAQGTESYTSDNFAITEKRRNYSLPVGHGFNLCDTTKVTVEMVNGSDVINSSPVKVHTFSGTATNSKIESLSVSKGYYTDRVRLNWKVSNENEFARYLVYRQEYESTDTIPVLVATVSHSSGVVSYSTEDMQTQPGVFYTYTVQGQKDCQAGNINTIAFLSDQGYVQPYGTVSGRVTYAAGTAVPGVSVTAEGTESLKNKAMDFTPANNTYIQTPYKAGTLDPYQFSFQAWVKLRPYDSEHDSQWSPTDPALEGTDTKRQQFLYAQNKYNVTLWNDGKLTLEYWSESGGVREISSDVKIPSDIAYHHITVTFSADTVNRKTEIVFYLDGVPKDTRILDDKPKSFVNDSLPLNFGRNTNIGGLWLLNGYMDELRLWTKALTAEEIKSNYNAYISGKEEGLSLYYRFDEVASLERVFDLSGRNGRFNENHGNIYGTVYRTATEIPGPEQLSIKANTDANGYYEINTIPYSADGNTYIIRPLLGVHDFDPGFRQPRFQPGSSVHTIDFKDISSFKVSGQVFYAGGSYPVEGCSFTVDGKTLVHPNGAPVLSDDKGVFNIEVPIGIHEVKVVKTGHTFADDGKLLKNGENINYFEPYSDATFWDSTRVKLVGRVVGGKREHAKPLGFGESLNNIGVETIQLKALSLNGLLNTTGGENDTIVHNRGEWRRDPLKNDTTKVNIANNTNTVSITISPETGEFVAYLPPVKYDIQKIQTKLYDGTIGYDDEVSSTSVPLDLTDRAVANKDLLKKSIRTWTDSVDAVVRPGELPHKVAVEYSDTITYNEEWKFFYQGVPTFRVKQLNVPYFGEKEVVQQNPITAEFDTIPLVDAANKYLFKHPVFLQAGDYTFEFEAFERYVNYRKSTEDIMPVATGQVEMINNLRIDAVATDIVELDSLGKGTYTFSCGAPDMTSGIKTFQAILRIDGVGYYGDYSDGQEAFLLGAKSTGNDFITAGPDKVDFVVHDPPGTSSYAFIEKGTTLTTTTSYSLSGGLGLGVTAEANLGADVITFAGVGAGVITAAKATLKITDELKEETTYKHGNEKEETTTVTERIETSASPDYVGHAGDIFVGNSTNSLYGWVNSISPARYNKVTKPLENIVFDPANENPPLASDTTRYVIARTSALAYGEEIDTRFAFTEYELENIMIPKWKANRDLQLRPYGFYKAEELAAITSPVYESYLAPDHPDYGKLNTDVAAFGKEASPADKYYDGKSYRIYFPPGFDGLLGEKSLAGQLFKMTFVDSVAWYYQNIKQWEDRLAENEKEKVNMENLGNYSFGAGGAITRSEQTSSKQTKTNEWNIVLTNTFGETAGAEFSGVGLSIAGQIVTTFGYGGTSNSSNQDSKTVGFVLKEEGTTDQLTVDYGKTKSGGIAFKLRGGRTSCPYEGEVRTKYFEPGKHVLSEATWKVEDPKLSVEGGVQKVLRVPAIRPASFELELKNESETGNDGYFQIVVGENTNPDGAIIKIDGLPIGNGRSFTVPSGVGKILKKNLTIEKGPVKDKYEDIAIILRSQCETSLASKVLLSVNFLPSSSDVAFKAPSDRWVINILTSDTMNIVLNNYDVNYADFGHVELQYRSTASAEWKTIRYFYGDSVRWGSNPGVKSISSVLQPSDTEINYRWATKDVPDGTYELRARTVCETTDGGFISEFITESLTGTKDMTRPSVLGRPSPVTGILTASDELSILFNEDIQSGLLQNKVDHFSVKGVLNESIIAVPDAGLSFDGKKGEAHTELPLYTAGSFTFETWFKRTLGTAGTLFAYGEGANYLSLGFNAAGHAVAAVGNDTIISNDTIANDDTWKYIALVYDRTGNAISVYKYENASNNIELIKATLNDSIIVPSKGKLYVGNNATNNAGFNGALSGLHFYSDKRSAAEISSSKSLSKSGTEANLAGYWELDESEGTTAKDKARSRHLRLNTGWYVYPQGRAVTLNGSQHISVDGSENTFTINDDFTLEFWFKGSKQAATLFSSDDAVSIVSDNNGKLSLYVGTVQQALTQTSVLNDEWRHFALSVKRNGTATAYIDGVATAQFNSNIINEVGGWLTYGAKRTVPYTTAQYSEFFSGSFDEIRVWASALTGESVKLNKNSKLHGTEKGLLGYYPFETYVTQTNGIVTVTAGLQNMVADTLLNKLTADAPAPTEPAPALKNVRPVVNVPFDCVVSNNKVVFTLTEELYRTEGVTLELAAWDILDLRGNPSNIEKWTAYVNLNPLKWATDPVNLVKKESESLTFIATISNNGGVKTDYYIEELPEWLTATSIQGTLNPLEKKNITFQVSNGVNIGSYEGAIVMKGVNKVREILPVTLKVMGEKPDWSVNPNDYDFTMNVIGQIQILGAFQEDEDDIVGAFIGDLCVGVGSPEYVNALNAYYLYLDVYGNTEHLNRPVTFKLWDASTGRIYPQIETSVPDIKFVSHAIIGTIAAPLLLNATDVMEQSIALKKGWNWMSANVLNTNPSILDQMKTSLSEVGTQIKGISPFLTKPAGNWVGNLTSVSATAMYQVSITADHTLVLKGTLANPLTTSITLADGWNWIGYTPAVSMSVKAALAGIDAKTGDQIKGLSKFAQYADVVGWLGSLKDLQPGVGYMYKSNDAASKSFHYPNASALRLTEQGASATVDSKWTTDPHRFSGNMTITAIVLDNGTEMHSDLVEIAAFAGNECRGSALLEYAEGLEKPYLGFLTVYGEPGDPLSFKVYDHANKTEYTASAPVNTFTVDGIYGDPFNPETIKINSVTGIIQINGALRIYPNPVKDVLYLDYEQEKLDMLEICDVTGKAFVKETDFVEKSLRISNLMEGVYLLKVTVDGKTSVHKFVKQ